MVRNRSRVQPEYINIIKLIDNFGISLVTTTTAFGLVLVLVFIGWYSSEKTISIHSIHSIKREAWYWLTVLATFALGTASGDLVAEKFKLGYMLTVVLFASLIALVILAHKKFRLGAVIAFWLAYILTRPLGASIGDYLSQAKKIGGLGLGTTVTSVAFLSAITALVIYLTKTKRDQELM